MTWRFRKRKKLFPGVTLNITNKSLGVTVGNRGGRVSVNSRGRVTAGQSIPSSGLYRQQVLKAGKRPKSLPTRNVPTAQSNSGCLSRVVKWGAGLIVILFACGILASLLPRTSPQSADTSAPAVAATPTVTPTIEPSKESSPTAEPTSMPAPTSTPAPTATATAEPTSTPSPTIPVGPVVTTDANVREGPGTEYPVVIGASAGQAVSVIGQDSSGQWLQLASGYWIATSLVANVPADLPVVAVAAQLPGGNPTPAPAEPTPGGWQREERGVIFRSDCPCDQGDILNCGDFGIDMDAQACYLRCLDLTGRDVHGLDRDKDRGACEWNW